MHALTSEILEELTRIVGKEFVSTGDALRDRLARTTSPEDGNRPLGLVQPAHRAHVQALVTLARKFNIPLYPISTGKNWGYGDACAAKPDCLIMDLSRMNRILEVNVELAYAVIEPGVTQGQLAQHLLEHQLPLQMDCTGSGPDASLIGNTMERGFGHSPYGDRFASSCNYEAVLPDGSFTTTGFGHYPNAQAQHLFKWGIGPSIDGMLTQSNLGIVTRMTLWLMPRPESTLYFFITLKTPAAIGGLVEVFRELRLRGTMRSTVHCFNDGRQIAGQDRYPWAEADGRQAIELQHPDLFKRLIRQHGLAAWAAVGILMGSPAETAAACKTMKQALKGIPDLDRLVFINDKHIPWMNRLAVLVNRCLPTHWLRHTLTNVRTITQMLKGIPSYDTLKGSHWRARIDPPPTQDPLENKAGLIWISPVLPMTRAAINDLTQKAEPIFHQFGFEYQTTLSCTTDRALSAIMSICFDRSSPEETARAQRCAETLTDALLEAGYIPYRGSPQVMARVRKRSPEYWRKLAELKRAWDPTSILAPGRYIDD